MTCEGEKRVEKGESHGYHGKEGVTTGTKEKKMSKYLRFLLTKEMTLEYSMQLGFLTRSRATRSRSCKFDLLWMNAPQNTHISVGALGVNFQSFIHKLRFI